MAVSPKRRWYQFSLKAMLVFVTLTALASWYIHRAHEQHEAMRVLRARFAPTEIGYAGDDDVSDDDPYEPGHEIKIVNLGMVSEQLPGRFSIIEEDDDQYPTRLRKFQEWMGKDYFRTVVAVGLSGGDEEGKVTTPEWRAMSQLHGLQSLDLDWIESIRDDDLTWLKPLTSLERLFLAGASVGDRGLEKLAGLTNLRYLGLENTKITDDGLVHLQNLSRLEMLALRNTEITDAGLVHLRSLKGPTAIYLSGTKVTEQGAQELQAALPNCKVLLMPPVSCPFDEYKGPATFGGFF